MKTQEQKEKDKQIKDAYKNIRHKTAFVSSLANHLGKSKDAVKASYFFGAGTPIEYQDIVLEKINLQLQYDKITEEKVWNTK